MALLRNTDARPPFAQDYPKDPEIEALLALFEAGDYGAMRERAKKLESRDEGVRLAVRDLVARTEPDPAMRWIFLGILAMILGVTAYWLTRR